MKKYEIETITDNGDLTCYAICNTETGEYFSGYDFMGSVNWMDHIGDDSLFVIKDEALQVIEDLKAADYDEQYPEGKTYLLKYSVEGESCKSIETAKRIAEIYEENQECGIYSDFQVWDVDGEPKRINLLDLVSPILAQKRWMEQEYRDYCENEAYGDY